MKLYDGSRVACELAFGGDSKAAPAAASKPPAAWPEGAQAVA